MTPAQALQKYFGYNQFRHNQAAIIDTLMGGRDVFTLMPTGGGKSLCYQLPAVLMPGLTIVISPLIALMKDQVDGLKQAGIPAAFINSMQTGSEQQHIMQLLRQNEIKLLYVSPERLFSNEARFISYLQTLKVSLIAIDEAHCISQWGHDFRPEYLMLAGLKTAFRGVPVIALTATAEKLTRKDILEKLALNNPAQFVSSFNRPNISYTVASKKNSFNQLLAFLNARKDDAGIIYCLSRDSTEKLAEKLREAGFTAAPYHAGLDNETKNRNQEAFLRDDIQIIVATIAFGMGINKSNVRYVVHADLPKNIEGYYQETGRAGRDGLPSEALLFYSFADVNKLKSFAQIENNPAQTQVLLGKLDDMVKFCQLHTCRRQYLLKYFGEDFPPNCGSCDVCLTEVQKFDATLIAQKALSAVARVKERFGINYVIDFLRGSKSEKMREEHKALKTYGVGADVSKADWHRYIRELISLEYLELTDAEYPVLKLTPKSEAVLKGLEKVELIASQVTEERKAEEVPPHEAELFDRLRTIRHGIAEQENVPAYNILSDASLMELATYLPQSLSEVRLISGFGDIKLARYGQEFLNPVQNYCQIRGLGSRIAAKSPKRERKAPKETASKPASSKKDTRQETYVLFRAGKTIAEIAKERELSPTTIESHLGYFVFTGDIEVTEMVPERKIAAIHDAVQSYGDERLAPLKEVLGDGYTYAEIKAVISWMKRDA